MTGFLSLLLSEPNRGYFRSVKTAVGTGRSSRVTSAPAMILATRRPAIVASWASMGSPATSPIVSSEGVVLIISARSYTHTGSKISCPSTTAASSTPALLISHSAPPYCASNALFSILPTLVRGKSSTNSIRSGCLNDARYSSA